MILLITWAEWPDVKEFAHSRYSQSGTEGETRTSSFAPTTPPTRKEEAPRQALRLCLALTKNWQSRSASLNKVMRLRRPILTCLLRVSLAWSAVLQNPGYGDEQKPPPPPLEEVKDYGGEQGEAGEVGEEESIPLDPCPGSRPSLICVDQPSTQQRWYWDDAWFRCLATRVPECEPNPAYFSSKAACDEVCRPMDGPTCSGPEPGISRQCFTLGPERMIL